jgi:hypothetical protein
VCEVGRFGRGVPRGWDFTRGNPECDEEGGPTVFRRGTKRVVDVLGETETAAEAGGAESKEDGRAGGHDPRGVVEKLLVEAWICVVREEEERKGKDVVERAGECSGGAAAAGCRPRKTPELIFLVSDTSFFQAGVRLELSIEVNGF